MNIEMQMKVVELAVEEFHYETHGMIQNMVEVTEVNFQQNQVVIKHHRHQQTQLQQQLKQQQQHQANRNKVKHAKLLQAV